MARPLKIAAVLALVIVQVYSSFAGATEFRAESGESQPPLRWRTKIITLSLSTSLLRPAANVKAGSDLVDAVRRSLKTWEQASGVEFRLAFSDKQDVSPQGAVGDGVNLITVAPSAENALLFARNAETVAATTRVFFDSRGRISEADIALNPYQQFSADGTFGTFDIESAFTHELGHVLGLEHSLVRGSAMYENFGKNGLFGLQSISPRTLSEIDRAAVRAKYGSPADESCCGTISAKVLMPGGRPAAALEVWLEDRATGKVVSEAVTARDGVAEFDGIAGGSYSVFSARKDGAKRAVPMQELGPVAVVPGGSASITKKLEPGADEIDAKYTGFNGQLTLSSIPINSGKSYTIYIGGRNLKPNGVSVSFSSPFLSVTPGSIESHDYGEGLAVLSFEVQANERTPVGEYTIFVESASGGRSAIVGGISVRAFTNPYSNFIFDNKLQ
ncbi:MAG: matrixin family metalloprotease [Acidobacteria bacterium]|nr:matrixin family metalloprotease [Acidobacteriota bacterium]